MNWEIINKEMIITERSIRKEKRKVYERKKESIIKTRNER